MSKPDRVLLGLSIVLQVGLGLFFGHAYDMRIFMATGYLVGTGQNYYIPQDLGAVFHDGSFNGITSIGYPPPWPLMTGAIYSLTYRLVPNLLLYNLALKIPIIAGNIGLAFLTAAVLRRLGAGEKAARGAWLFFLFNPFFLYVSTAWGQIDSIAALLTVSALFCLDEDKLSLSAVLLALAIAFKPTPLPVILVVFIALLRRPYRRLVGYFVILLASGLVFTILPFLLFHWDPTPVITHWNAVFSVGGGMSFMTFLELFAGSYSLYGWWWLVGMLWAPALGVAAARLRTGQLGLLGLIYKSTVLILVFFLFRSWLSETNLVLVLPFLVILVGLGKMDSRILTAVLVVAFAYSFFNTSTFQLLFPSLPGLMDRSLQWIETFRTARLILRILLVLPWLGLGGWMVRLCLRLDRAGGNPTAA